MLSSRFARLRFAAIGCGLAVTLALTACSGTPDTPDPGAPVPFTDQTAVRVYDAQGKNTDKRCITLFGGSVTLVKDQLVKYDPPVFVNMAIHPGGRKIAPVMQLSGFAGATKPTKHDRIELGTPCGPGTYIKVSPDTLREAPGRYQLLREEYLAQRRDIAQLVDAEGQVTRKPVGQSVRLTGDNTVAMLNLRPVKILGVTWAFWSECNLRSGGATQPIAKVNDREIYRYTTKQSPRTVDDCPSGTLYDNRDDAFGKTRDLAPLYN